MPRPIEPEIVEEPYEEDRHAAAFRREALKRIDVLIKKIEENTRTNQHLIRLLEERKVKPGQLAVPAAPQGPTAFDRVADHVLEAFPPNYLRNLAEEMVHGFTQKRPRRRR